MAVSPSLHSSHSTFSRAFKYHVFLSFRGTDTRHGFTGNLYKALSDRGIKTFIDDKDLQRGDEITPSLMKAIQESRIAIPIFSINYAASSFCLEELVNIIDCVKAKGRLVLPVFYDVDPSDVRHQTGTYGKALAEHEARFNKDNMERIQKWKIALTQVANLSGYHYKHGDGYEHKFIGKIIEEVSKKINRVLLPVADYPVGLESQVLKVNLLLDVESGNGVHFVGIHGMGGLGKTTLALAVYHSIADNFESFCFLENVRENSNKHGLQHLQSILLCRTLGEQDIKLTSVKEGISMIKDRLQQKKVLLILDDVDKQEHLQAIVGEPNWFGPGSRVIITTRDKHLLASNEVEKTFEVKKLDKEDALQLLKWNAFKLKQVDPSYLDVLNRVVTYASGLPLALKVIGSNLHGKDIEAWESALNKYARIPINDILQVLKISFDALDEEEKNVFLDIACCFKGYGLEEVNEILCAHHGDNMKDHIRVLVDKSLIKIVDSYNSEVTLHDLIEDMGKEIVRQESLIKLGKRSRLWFYKDVVQILEDNKGSNKIEIIFLQFPFSKEEVKWDGVAFKKMKNLRTVIIKNGSFSQGPSHFPNSLRVLEWNKYPSEDLPSDFCPNKLVICKLSNSRISSLGLTSILLKKEFGTLSNLNFDKCEFLTEIPDISCLKCLQSLSLNFCKSLQTIDNSVGSLKKLKSLHAYGCRELRSFPPLKMTSLEYLNLSCCDRLESFAEISVGSLKKLKILRAQGCRELRSFPPLEMTSLEELDLSYCDRLESFPEILVRSLKKLKSLRAQGCRELRSFSPLQTTSLEELDLSDCDRLESFPEISVKMENMTDIILAGTPIKKLPRSFRNLTKLKSLYMTPSSSSSDVGTSLFQSIITMPELTEIEVERIAGWVIPKENEVEQNVCTSKVQSIILKDCRLTDEFFLVVATWFANVKVLILSEGHFIIIPECIKGCCFLEKLELIECWDLQEIRAIPQNLKHLEAIDCPDVTDSCISMLLKQELHETGNTHFIVPYTPVPEWFHHQSRGPSVSFWFRNNLPELVLCVALPDQYPLSEADSLLEFYLFINGNICSDLSSAQYFSHIHLFNLNEVTLERNLNEVLSENEWNFAEFTCLYPWSKTPITDIVIESGIHVLKQESSMKDIQFTDPSIERKLEDDLDISESPNHQLLKRHKSLDMDISGIDIVQQQRMGFWSRMWNQACSCFSFLVAQLFNHWMIMWMRIQGLWYQRR